MKRIVVSLLLLVTLGFTSCTKTAEIETESDTKNDPLKEYTQDSQQAKLWLPGTWKLVKVYAMIPDPVVPPVELIFEANQISVVENGKQIDRVDFEVVKLDNGLLIKTNAQPKEDNWYVRNPGLYMNQNRMYLDLGRAMDGPAYEFKKVN
ncbi:hypothetical protein GCM10027592_18870 [Spirosoma flavus]